MDGSAPEIQPIPNPREQIKDGLNTYLAGEGGEPHPQRLNAFRVVMRREAAGEQVRAAGRTELNDMGSPVDKNAQLADAQAEYDRRAATIAAKSTEGSEDYSGPEYPTAVARIDAAIKSLVEENTKRTASEDDARSAAYGDLKEVRTSYDQETP
jgi:hypothetical protein